MTDRDFSVQTAIGRDLDAMLPTGISRDGRSDAELRSLILRAMHAQGGYAEVKAIFSEKKDAH